MKEREKEKEYTNTSYILISLAGFDPFGLYTYLCHIYICSIILYSMEHCNTILPIYTPTHPPDLYPTCQIGQGIASAQAKHTHRWARCQ